MKLSLNANTATKENLYKTVIPYRKTSVRNFFAYFKKFFERIPHLTCYNLIFTGIICGLIPSLFLSDDQNFGVKLAKLTDHFAAFSIISVASVLALLVVSWMLSSVIYEHKEL